MWLADIDDLGGGLVNVPRPLFDTLPELAAYEVHPVTPDRIYAGDLPITVFLRFADEAQALAVLSAYVQQPDAA